MAKRKRYSASKCSDPLDTALGLAGAVAMGAYAKHKVKSDYKKGHGEESVKAAMMVYGMGSMRRGSDGLLALGGLYGVKSALRDIEKSERNEQLARRRRFIYDDGIDFPTYRSNDNQYAWRLNCEDGSAYGISPMDYETRDAYNRALQNARGGQLEERHEETPAEAVREEFPFEGSPLLCCRVSRLDNGANEYYLSADDSLKVGDKITVSTDAGTTDGVVIGVKRLSEMTEDELPKENMWILMQEEDEDAV